MGDHEYENNATSSPLTSDLTISDATPAHIRTPGIPIRESHPSHAGGRTTWRRSPNDQSVRPAVVAVGASSTRPSPQTDGRHHQYHQQEQQHAQSRQRAQSAPRVRPVIYKSTNLARTAPDLVASASPDVMSSVRAIQKANETAERVRDNFQSEREKQLERDTASNDPIFGNDEDSNARKYKRRLKLNRQSAAASRVRREAYTKALESEIVNMDSTYKKIVQELEEEREETRRLRLYIDSQGTMGQTEQTQEQDDGHNSGRTSSSNSQINRNNYYNSDNTNTNNNNNRNDTTSNLNSDLTQNNPPHQGQLNNNDQKLTNNTTAMPTASPQLQHAGNGSASMSTPIAVPVTSDWYGEVGKKEDVEGCDRAMDDKGDDEKGDGHSVPTLSVTEHFQNNPHAGIPISSTDIGDTNEFTAGPVDPLNTPLILSQNASSDVQPHASGPGTGMIVHNNNPRAYPEQGNETEGGSAVGKSSDFEFEHIAHKFDLAPEVVRALQSPTDELVVDTPDCFFVSDENVMDGTVLGQGHPLY